MNRRVYAWLAIGVGVALASTASAATAAAADPATAERGVAPRVECVFANGNGTFTASFGYDNTTGEPVAIPAERGANDVSPASADIRQPSTFASGEVRNAFTVTWDGATPLTWQLGRDVVTATSATARCPASAGVAAGRWLAIAAGLVVVVPFVIAARRGESAYARRQRKLARAVAADHAESIH